MDFEGAFDHILVAESVDLVLVAPATASCIAKLAAGVADDFLTTFHLAVTAPVVLAPAMNARMWAHPSVQANLKTLTGRGVRVIDPEIGKMACQTGKGLAPSKPSSITFPPCCSLDLKGRRVLAGRSDD
jgi:phosphopantothenoylcysteine synthetase/decarboxylase